jgi:protoheme IX farnesyltransferase
MRYRDDYVAAEVPMLPVVASFTRTARRILAYSLALWVVSVAFAPIGGMGDIYLAAALVLGGMFVVYALRLLREGTPAAAMRLFGYSISYVTLLFSAMAVDELVRHR